MPGGRCFNNLAHISKHTVGDFVRNENVCLLLDLKKTIKCDILVWTHLSDTAAVTPRGNQPKLNMAKWSALDQPNLKLAFGSYD